MNIKEMRYFIELAQVKNFTKAAQNLTISQPCLSKGIKLLEHDTGLSLIERDYSKKFKLTKEGEFFYKKASKCIEAIDKEILNLNEEIRVYKNSITIGIPPIINIIYFAPILVEFKNKYPDLKIKIIEEGSRSIKEKILSNELDIGITVEDINHDLIKSIDLSVEKLGVYLHKNHKLANQKEINMNQIRDEKFILLDGNFILKHKIINECTKNNFKPNIVFESSQWHSVIEMVLLEQGITILPCKIDRKLNINTLKSIKLIDSNINLNISMIYNSDYNKNINLDTFIDFIVDNKNLKYKNKKEASC